MSFEWSGDEILKPEIETNFDESRWDSGAVDRIDIVDMTRDMT